MSLLADELVMVESTSRILAIKTHALGDLLLVTPALHRIKHACPDAEIVVLTTAHCAPLLIGNTDVDTVVALPGLTPSTGTFRALTALRALHSQIAVVFQASRFAYLVARYTGARSVFALNRGKTNRTSWPPPLDVYTGTSYQGLVERFLPESESVSPRPRLSVTDTERAQARSRLQFHGGILGRYVVVAPGGGTNLRQSVPEKRWPAKRFAELCRLLEQRLHLPAVIVGSSTDVPVANTVAFSAGTQAVNLVGQTNLRLLAAFVREANLVVCNDSVVLHMAVALGTPVVGLFGPTAAANFLPGTPGPYIGISSGSSCSPCYGNGLFPGCRQGTAACMDDIPVDRVYHACEESLR